MLMARLRSYANNDLLSPLWILRLPHVPEPDPPMADPGPVISLVHSFRVRTLPSSAFVKFNTFKSYRSAASL
jgi:hypothetical protein